MATNFDIDIEDSFILLDRLRMDRLKLGQHMSIIDCGVAYRSVAYRSVKSDSYDKLSALGLNSG